MSVNKRNYKNKASKKKKKETPTVIENVIYNFWDKLESGDNLLEVRSAFTSYLEDDKLVDPALKHKSMFLLYYIFKFHQSGEKLSPNQIQEAVKNLNSIDSFHSASYNQIEDYASWLNSDLNLIDHNQVSTDTTSVATDDVRVINDFFSRAYFHGIRREDIQRALKPSKLFKEIPFWASDIKEASYIFKKNNDMLLIFYNPSLLNEDEGYSPLVMDLSELDKLSTKDILIFHALKAKPFLTVLLNEHLVNNDELADFQGEYINYVNNKVDVNIMGLPIILLLNTFIRLNSLFLGCHKLEFVHNCLAFLDAAPFSEHTTNFKNILSKLGTLLGEQQEFIHIDNLDLIINNKYFKNKKDMEVLDLLIL